MKDMQIIVFGDSIVRGAADWKNGGWAQLLRSYVEKKSGFRDGVYILGAGGDASSDILKRFENELKPRAKRAEKNVVIISVGTNDSAYFDENKRKAWVSEAQYQKNLEKLIALVRKHTKEVFFVGLLPVVDSKVQPVPWHKEISYSSENCRKYNELAKDVCRKEDVSFLDVFDTFSKLNYTKLLADGVHPTTEGHRKIFGLVLDFLKKNKVLA